MPYFEVLGQQHYLSEKELAVAPQSLLAEAASLHGGKEEAIVIKDWREPSHAVFQVIYPKKFPG